MDMNPKGHRKSRKIPEVLTPEEQATLLGELEADTPAGARNNCLVRLMLDAGLRSAEVLALRHRDIDFKSGQLMVRNGKGGKDRSLWLGPDLVALLRTFVETQGNVRPGDLLFTTKTGRPLLTRYLRSMVGELAKKAGIEKHIHPHTLRHSFATDLLRQSRNLMIVSKALGHANLATTQIYLHICDPEMEEAMKGLRKNGGA